MTDHAPYLSVVDDDESVRDPARICEEFGTGSGLPVARIPGVLMRSPRDRMPSSSMLPARHVKGPTWNANWRASTQIPIIFMTCSVKRRSVKLLLQRRHCRV